MEGCKNKYIFLSISLRARWKGAKIKYIFLSIYLRVIKYLRETWVLNRRWNGILYKKIEFGISQVNSVAL